MNIRLFALTIAAAMLTACGGTSKPIATQTNMEGLYFGNFSSGLQTELQLLVLEDGQVWGTYGSLIAGGFVPGAIFHGEGTSNNGWFISTNVTDFGTSPPATSTVEVDFVQGRSANGSISTSTVRGTFATTAPGPSIYEYDSAATVSAISGMWSDGSIMIAENGSYTISRDRCISSGTITPRRSGKNVFDITWAVGPEPCQFAWGTFAPGATFAGIAYNYTDTAGYSNLTMNFVDSTSTDAGWFAFFR